MHEITKITYFSSLDDALNDLRKEASGESFTGMHEWYDGRFSGILTGGLLCGAIGAAEYNFWCEIRAAWYDAYKDLRKAA